jgi:multidrug efflux pump subunit AcrA (membrane-fusion protein)
LAIALVITMTWRAMRSDAQPTSAGQQTVTVDTGDVRATVSASGNVEPATTVEASFAGEGGTVTHLYVTAGEKVRKGQLLASIDRTSARQSLGAAQAQLDSARASYTTTVQGRTAAERAQDASSIASADQQVRSAETSLAAARATYALDRRQQDAAVARAQKALDDAVGAEARSAARQALVSARDSRDSRLLQDRQQVASAQQQVASARIQASSSRAQVAVDAQGATAGAIASARAQVASAQVSLDQARTAYDETLLRAPVAGTVASVNGAVGETSSGGSSSATSASASDGTTKGLITLTSAGVLEVTADVAEADIDDIEVGQTATVTLSATDKQVTGTVTHIDTVQTVTNNVVEYGVTVRLAKGSGVRLGATAQVVVTTGAKDGVTRVASSALTTIGNRTTATLLRSDGTTQTVEVVPGLAGDAETEVLSGLQPGDRVVLPQQDTSSSTGFTFPRGGLGGPVGGAG